MKFLILFQNGVFKKKSRIGQIVVLTTNKVFGKRNTIYYIVLKDSFSDFFNFLYIAGYLGKS